MPVQSRTNLLRLRELTDNICLEEMITHHFFELSPDLFAVINSDGYFIRVNQAWDKILGWSEAYLLSQRWITLLHSADAFGIQALLQTLDDAVNLRCRVRTATDEYMLIEFSIVKWPDGQLSVVGRISGDAPQSTNDNFKHQGS